MTIPNRIPLFPLDLVLFPAMQLPLHIFEPGYKVMVRRCLEETIEFGIVLATKETIAPIGCTARIVRKVKDYPDDRMDILTEGSNVFRLTEVLDENQYHEGIVEYLADEPLVVDLLQEKRLIELFESCHMLLFGASRVEEVGGDGEHLAYRMASRLPIDLRERQSLLAMRSERRRREFLERWLAELRIKLEQQQRTVRRAGSNGHARG